VVVVVDLTSAAVVVLVGSALVLGCL